MLKAVEQSINRGYARVASRSKVPSSCANELVALQAFTSSALARIYPYAISLSGVMG